MSLSWHSSGQNSVSLATVGDNIGQTLASLPGSSGVPESNPPWLHHLDLCRTVTSESIYTK